MIFLPQPCPHFTSSHPSCCQYFIFFFFVIEFFHPLKALRDTPHLQALSALSPTSRDTLSPLHLPVSTSLWLWACVQGLPHIEAPTLPFLAQLSVPILVNMCKLLLLQQLCLAVTPASLLGWVSPPQHPVLPLSSTNPTEFYLVITVFLPHWKTDSWRTMTW